MNSLKHGLGEYFFILEPVCCKKQQKSPYQETTSSGNRGSLDLEVLTANRLFIVLAPHIKKLETYFALFIFSDLRTVWHGFLDMTSTF